MLGKVREKRQDLGDGAAYRDRVRALHQAP